MPYTTVVAGTTITAAWGNANVRDQVITPFATTAARTSAITAPIAGMVSAQTDAKVLDFYDGAAWVPVGPLLADALKVTAAPPVVSGAAFSSEGEINAKFRLTLPQVRAGEAWLIGYSFMYNQSASGSDFTFRVREDNTSGTVVKASYLANVGANINPFQFVALWVPSTDATNKVLITTAARNTGAQTLSIWNNTVADGANDAWALRIGKGSLFRSVP